MTRIFVPILFLFCARTLFAQNMVPNGSFECGMNICFPNNSAANFPRLACDWSSPNYATSDLYHLYDGGAQCYTAMPTDFRGPTVGSQFPRTGKRFAGIITYFDNDAFFQDYREYLQVKMETAMVIGRRYCGEFYISPAARAQFVSNNMGMYFHNESMSYDQDTYLPFSPQIIENEIVKDTTQWIKVTGIVTAKKGYRYVTIGNFSTDKNTQTEQQSTWHSTVPTNNRIAYYFIDDVSVVPFPDRPFNFQGDVVACAGKPSTIKALGNVEDVQWTTLQDTTRIVSYKDLLSFTPTVTTTYRVRGKSCNVFVSDTITVVVNPSPAVSLGDDRTVCKGDSVILDAGSGFKSYHWQDGSTGATVSVKQTGHYTLQVSNEYNCYTQDDIQVYVLDVPKANLGIDRFYCNNVLPLRANRGLKQEYLWSTGATDSVITPTYSGSYAVQIKNHCGQSSDTVQVFSLHDLFIPNVVTLNDDEYNAKFKVGIKLGPDKTLDTNVDMGGKMKIINQWGSEIFTDPHYVNTWPRQSEDLEGTYYYGFNFGNCPIVKGWVQVIR